MVSSQSWAGANALSIGGHMVIFIVARASARSLASSRFFVGLLFVVYAALLLVAPAIVQAAPSEKGRGLQKPPLHKVSRLVGVLTEQASERCDGSGKVEWVHSHHEVGFIVLKGKVKNLRRFENLPVVISGEPRWTWRPPSVKRSGDCPSRALPDGWVNGPHGVRPHRTPGLGFAAFRAMAVRAWSGLVLTKIGAEVEVGVRNDFSRDLRDLRMVMRYKNCGGQGGALSRTEVRPLLRRHKQLRVRFPQLLRRQIRGKPRVFVASDLELSSKNTELAWDMVWTMKQAGAPCACPVLPAKKAKTP